MQSRRQLAEMLGVTLLFFLAARLGFVFSGQGYLTPVWPPAAVACAAAILYGPGSLLGVAIYVFYDYVAVDFNETARVGRALIEPLSLIAAAFASREFARRTHFDGTLSTVRSVLLMMGLALLFASVNAFGDTLGYCGIVRTHRCMTDGWFAHWGQSMVGDLFGCLVCLPALMSWAAWWRSRTERAAVRASRGLKSGVLRSGAFRLTHEMWLYLCVAVVFMVLAWAATRQLRLPVHVVGFLALPLLVWSAMKFPPLFVHTSILLTGLLTITLQLTAPAEVQEEVGTYVAALFLFLLSVVSLSLIVSVVVQQQRRMADQLAFRVQQDRIEVMLQAASDAVVSFDEQGLLSYWNPAAERLFGRPTRSVAGRPVHMLLPCPPLVATAGVGIAGLCNAGDPLFSGAVVEVTSVDAAGRPLPLEVSFTAYRNGHAWNATAFVRDARAHKRQEEELRQARDRAEEATRAKSLFLATMSHELRTPLSGVIGMMQLGLRESMSPQARSRIELGLANAEALLTIINDILDFSKIEAGKMTFEAVDFDPRELVQSLVELLDYRAQEKGLSLLMHVDPSVPRWLRSDPVRVRQVLLNLIGNALKFTETGGVDVDLACHSDGAGQLWLQVGVRDTGIGISPEAQTRLFQGFEQADVTTTRKYGGTGLGLTITRSLIDGMRGHLALDSEPGSGSCFRFELPVRVGAPVLARDEEVLGAFDCRLQILCAEDGHTNRVIVQAFVQGMGHDVEFVENGLECVHRCAEARFDLILMDGRMPVMDGLEAARAIRAGGLEDTFVLDPGLWMIALTANATAKDRDECMAAGMDDFLAKPVDERQLGFALHRAVTTLRARGHALRPLAPAPEAGLAGLDALFFGADVVPAPPPPAAPGATSPAAPAAMPQPPDATPVAQPPAAALTPLAERLREVFRTETPRLLAELAQALGVHDLGTAARIAHNIKGSAFYVECEPIAETAGALEHACDERSFERIDPAWVELQACYTRWTTEN